MPLEKYGPSGSFSVGCQIASMMLILTLIAVCISAVFAFIIHSYSKNTIYDELVFLKRLFYHLLEPFITISIVVFCLFASQRDFLFITTITIFLLLMPFLRYEWDSSILRDANNQLCIYAALRIISCILTWFGFDTWYNSTGDALLFGSATSIGTLILYISIIQGVRLFYKLRSENMRMATAS